MLFDKNERQNDILFDCTLNKISVVVDSRSRIRKSFFFLKLVGKSDSARTESQNFIMKYSLMIIRNENGNKGMFSNKIQNMLCTALFSETFF